MLETLRSLLEDGEKVVLDHWGNRVIPVVVQVSAATSGLLAKAEAALTAELHKPNTLTWVPADGLAPATVWDVLWSEAAQVPDDVAEAPAPGSNMLLRRKFAFTLTCLPSGRAAEESVAVAVAASGDPSDPMSHDTVDDCTATTHWTPSVGATITDLGSYLHFLPTSSAAYVALTAPGVLPVGVSDYLYVDCLGAVGDVFGFSTTAEAPLGLVARFPSPDVPGAIRLAYRLAPLANLTGIRFMGAADSGIGLGEVDFFEVFIGDQPPHIGTLRQKTLELPVGGTMRTPGRLRVEHETADLGMVIVYTYPDTGVDYSPALRQYRVSGGAVTDHGAGVSGSEEPLNSVVRCIVPAAQVMPGQHEFRFLLATVDNIGGDFSMSITAKVQVGATVVASEVLNCAFTLPGGGWWLITIGRLTLPTALLPDGSTANVVLDIVQTDGGSDHLRWDEGWFHNLDVGGLSIVNVPNNQRLRIDSPTTALTKSAYFVADEEDFSDGYYPDDSRILVFGQHQFTPPGMRSHVVTIDALDAVTSLYHYHRFHTHVADLS